MYVIIMSSLWKFTKKDWKRFCNCSVVAGNPEEPLRFGAKCVANYVPDITDWGTEQFAVELQRLKLRIKL